MPFAGLGQGADARVAYVLAGYLVPRRVGEGRVQVYGRIETIDGVGATDTSTRAIGTNYLLRGHDLKATVEWSWIDRNTGAPTVHFVTIQLQIAM